MDWKMLAERTDRLGRDEYEAACADAKIIALADADIAKAKYRIMQFHPLGYTSQPDTVPTEAKRIEMNLLARRLGQLYADAIAKREHAEKPQLDYPEGRVLDCGCTVYSKREVMSASLGSSCQDCYDRMSN